VLIPKTLWFSDASSQQEDSSEVNLAKVIAEAGMDQVVIKPIVSLSAHETWRSSLEEASAHQERFTNLLRSKKTTTTQQHHPLPLHKQVTKTRV